MYCKVLDVINETNIDQLAKRQCSTIHEFRPSGTPRQPSLGPLSDRRTKTCRSSENKRGDML